MRLAIPFRQATPFQRQTLQGTAASEQCGHAPCSTLSETVVGQGKPLQSAPNVLHFGRDGGPNQSDKTLISDTYTGQVQLYQRWEVGHTGGEVGKGGVAQRVAGEVEGG